MENEDDRILSSAKELSQRLGLEAFSPTAVAWGEYLHDIRSTQKIRVKWPIGGSFGHLLSPGYPIITGKVLLLRETMKGKLSPEEWEPLVCSSLIFFGLFRWKRNVGRLVALLPFITAFAVGVSSFLYFTLAGRLLLNALAISILFVAVLVTPFFPGVYFGRRFDHRLALGADKQAALLLGTNRLVDVLRKIATMRQADIDLGRQDQWRRFMFVPDIQTRIQNLVKIRDRRAQIPESR